jgi:hypothetical protein
MALHPRSLHPQALSFVSLFSTATTLYGVYKANRGLSNKVIHAVLKILTVVAAPLTLLLPFLYLAYSTDDYLNKQCSSASCLGTSWVAIAVGSAIAVIVVAYLTTPKVPSMHTFYRERLSTAFVARRSSKGSEVLLTQPAYREAIGLSDMEDVKAPDGNPIQRAHGERGPLPDSRMPRLVVCAAVNLSGDVVPPGRAAGSFTFESQESGGPLTGYVPTSVLEGASGHGVITLPAAMAISGAAVSPSMGRMTMAWLRPFLALFNVRLGVWLRNPLALPGVTDAAGHPLAQASAEEPTPDGPFKRPGLWYLLREMLGFNGLRSRYVYVTDGGHWENLGLVELIRRGCGQILCIDASGDKPDTFNTLGQALALARTELGVDVDIDVGGMAPARDTEMSETTHVQGTIRYPNGVKGTLIYMRTAITPKSPLDLQAYAKADPRFPHHSTADQLFTDQQLESYRGLGRAAAGDAAACLKQARVTIG